MIYCPVSALWCSVECHSKNMVLGGVNLQEHITRGFGTLLEPFRLYICMTYPRDIMPQPISNRPDGFSLHLATFFCQILAVVGSQQWPAASLASR